MTRTEQIELDKLSYRLATIYQTFGRLQHKHDLQDDDVTVIMDELVAIGDTIDGLSDAKHRLNPGEHGFPESKLST